MTDTRPTIDFRDIDRLKSWISDDYAPWSDAFTVTQALIDTFAALSGDDYWIHTDPTRAQRESPYGKTVAHGMLVQSLVSRMNPPFPIEITGYASMANYGSNRIRFPSPVPVDSRIHARTRVRNVEPVKAGTLLTLEIATHIVGQDRPSAVNEILILYR